MAAQTSLDAAVIRLEAALELCIRKIANVKQDQISFIGDITDILRDCGQFNQGSRRLNIRNLPMEYADICFARLGEKLGTSTLATSCFHLYTTTGGDSTAKPLKSGYSPNASVPDILERLEFAFRQLLGSRNIMIVLVQNNSGSVWVSDVSSQSLRDLFRADSIPLQQESRGTLPEERESPLKAFPQPTSTSVAKYPNTDFDALGILRRVATRKDPRIHIGPIDLSCAFVVCDLAQDDLPIIYASYAFEQLTGYTRSEILGRNCRFLQAPDSKVIPGVQTQSVNSHSLLKLKNQIAQGYEDQLNLINYKKGGQPFTNLLTVIPIPWDGDDYRYYVGFLIDITEHPGCISAKNANGTYFITYSRTQVSEPVNVPDAQADQPASVLQSNDPAERTALLSMTSPEADSPWSERDGLPPPYALSPGVFYHTSMMAMRSPR